jgi:hypothetical protein
MAALDCSPAIGRAKRIEPLFGLLIASACSCRQIIAIAAVEPGHPVGHLRKPDVRGLALLVHEYLCHRPSIGVDLGDANLEVAVVEEAAQVLRG